MQITTGKPLDVLALKGSSLQEIRDYATHLAALALTARSNGHVACPICSGLESGGIADIYGLTYRCCANCDHGYVAERVDNSQDPELAATYTDPDVDARLEQVVWPKLDWALEAYRQCFEDEPKRIIDVGAGGGHFVHAAHQDGFDAVGYEISEPARNFAWDTFAVDLIAEDFLEAEGTADIITFWGLLEYVPEPLRFLRAARERAAMVVVEVPRLNCLSTAVQAQYPGVVARHLDPTSHINVFSDTSLHLALEKSGFSPLAAWYFGMDTYELAVQLALRLGDENFEPLVEMLAPLQPALDTMQWCDDIIVAAT